MNIKAIPFRFGWQVIFHALLLALLFVPEMHPRLEFTDFNQIGEATIKRIDIPARLSSFYLYLLGFTIVLAISSMLSGLQFFKLPSKLEAYNKSLSAAGILLTASTFWNEAFLFPACWILGIQLLIWVFKESLSKQVFPAISLHVAAGISLLIWLNFNWIYPDKAEFGVQLMLLLILMGSFIYIQKGWTSDRSKLLLSNVLPFFVTALFPFFITEIRYFLQVRFNLQASPDFLYLIGLLIVTGISVWRRKHISEFRKSIQFTSWLLVSGFILHQFYVPFGEAPQEMYEMANRVLPLMEYHYFQVVPLLEKASSHFVSDYGFGLIYQALYGYHGLDFLIFDVLEMILWGLVVFVLVKKLSRSSMFAFFVAVMFPFTFATFSNYYLMALLPLFAFLLMMRQNSVVNRWLFALSLVLLVPWRADLSVAYLVAMLGVIKVVYLTGKFKSYHWIVPAVLVGLGMGITFWTICYFNNIDWLKNLKAILDYLSSSQSYGLDYMGDETTTAWKLHHLILPLVSAIVLIYSFSKILKTQGKSAAEPWIITLFISIFVLVNLPRGLVRHGFAESTDNFLLSLGFVVLPYAIIRGAKIQKLNANVLLMVSWALMSIWLRFPERLPEATGFTVAYSAPVKSIEVGKHNEVRRYTENEKFKTDQIYKIVKYLRENLKDGETFYDFSNTPMLYYYAEKEVPSFFFQNPQNVHSMTLQQDWTSRIQDWKVPLVLFRHDPPSWWDATDGVQNELRHGIIALYIRQNYRFETKVGGYEVWKRKPEKP